MKTALAVTALFAVVVTGGIAVTKLSNKSKKEEAPKNTSQVVTVSTPTATGNIIDDLKNKENGEASAKEVLKFNNVDKNRVVYLNSDVNYYSMKEATNKLKELEKKSLDPIFLLIDSPGGSVIDGATLTSQMQASKAPVYTVCTRLCASMGAIIHSYGHKRYALDAALLMYHPASGGVQGQVPNMVSVLKTITRYIEKMNLNIVSRTDGKLSKQEFDTLVAYEIWIDSEDALEKGLLDGIVSLDIPNQDVKNPAAQSEVHEEEVGCKSKQTPVYFQMIHPYAKELWNY